jgi:hypothetical protein
VDEAGREIVMAKEFHLGDILSITHERLVSPRHMGGVYDILNYMTGDDLFTHQLPRACRVCRPILLKQHPRLATPEVDFEVAKLGEMLQTPSGKADPKALVDGWLFTMTLEYGEMLPVEPLRPADYEHHDPIQEAEETVGKDKVIVVSEKP